MPNPINPQNITESKLPQGQTLAKYKTYQQAQKATEHLINKNLEAKSISIVGDNIHIVEKITNKLNYPKIAAAGATSGAWIGIFIAIILSLTNNKNNPTQIFSTILLGITLGTLLSVTSYALSKNKKNFTSTNQIVAETYLITITPQNFQKAQSIFTEYPDKGILNKTQTPKNQNTPDKKPQYGQRI